MVRDRTSSLAPPGMTSRCRCLVRVKPEGTAAGRPGRLADRPSVAAPPTLALSPRVRPRSRRDLPEQAGLHCAAPGTTRVAETGGDRGALDAGLLKVVDSKVRSVRRDRGRPRRRGVNAPGPELPARPPAPAHWGGILRRWRVDHVDAVAWAAAAVSQSRPGLEPDRRGRRCRGSPRLASGVGVRDRAAGGGGGGGADDVLDHA